MLRELWPDRREALVVVNPAAHNLPKQKHLDEAGRWLAENGWSVRWQQTAKRGHAASLASGAADSRTPLLIVCGGDGTLSEAANGLAGSETTLAVIPAGTVNLWAREVGLMKKPLEAVRAAVEGDRRQMDLGLAGNRYFMMVAGFGIDAFATHIVSAGVKGRVGAAAYALASLRAALQYRGARVSVTLDGETLSDSVLMLVAGNTRNYAGLTQITPEAIADDGYLDICIYRGGGKLDIAFHAVRTLLRRHRRSKKVLYRRTRRLHIAADEPLPLQLDGDPCAESATDVSVAPKALWVAIPTGLKSPLFSTRPV